MLQNERIGVRLVVAGVLFGLSTVFFVGCLGGACAGPNQGGWDLTLHLDTLAVSWSQDCRSCGVTLVPALVGLVLVLLGCLDLLDFER
jgi:hypothetical protein